jgi:hypothetical protein
MEIKLLHAADATHLAEVMDDMRKLGSPTIRCAEVLGTTIALEGTHRLSAAEILHVPVIIKMVELADIPAIYDRGELDVDDTSLRDDTYDWLARIVIHGDDVADVIVADDDADDCDP